MPRRPPSRFLEISIQFLEIWYPFSLCPKSSIAEEEKEGKASICSCVQLVTLLKVEDVMFSFIKTPEGITNLPKTIFGSVDLPAFLPCPARTAQRSFILAPPCPAPWILLPLPCRKMLRPAHPCCLLVSNPEIDNLGGNPPFWTCFQYLQM